VGRRRFDHLVEQSSLGVREGIPRYPLWIRLHELGWNPEQLTLQAALSFCQGPLVEFLADRGLVLRPHELRRIRRAVSRFDPAIPTPYERMAEL
jgi:hypothetical protein